MTFVDFWRRQHAKLPIDLAPSDCAGSTYIVTGANNGLGYECTLHLVRLGAARVIMAVRNLDAGAAAKATIEAETGRKDVLDVWHVDLASYESVKLFVDKVEKELDRVDAVVENAAVALDKWVVQEGTELSLTVNVFATLLMAVLLLPYLQRTAAKFAITPRIAIVGSNAAFMVKDAFDKLDADNVLGDLNNREKWEPSMKDSYPMSKLLLHFAYRELAAQVPVSKTGVVINLSSPGLCSTGLTRNVAFSAALPIHVMRMVVGRSAEKGSRTLLSGIAAGEDSHGKYMTECEVNEEFLPAWMTDARGQKVQRKIGEEVTEALEKIQPGCMGALQKM